MQSSLHPRLSISLLGYYTFLTPHFGAATTRVLHTAQHSRAEPPLHTYFTFTTECVHPYKQRCTFYTNAVSAQHSGLPTRLLIRERPPLIISAVPLGGIQSIGRVNTYIGVKSHFFIDLSKNVDIPVTSV